MQHRAEVFYRRLTCSVCVSVCMQEYFIFRDGDILGKFLDTEAGAQSARMAS